MPSVISIVWRIVASLKIWRRYGVFWTTDHSLTLLLCMLVFLLFVVTPLVTSAAIRSELGTAFFSVLSLMGVATVARRRSVVVLVATWALLSIVFDWVARYSTTEQIQIVDVGLRTSFIVLLSVVVTLQVFRPGDVTHHRVQGAIVVYLLAGIAWGYAYEVVAIVNASAFSGKNPLLLPFARPGVFRYYSFETLTTLGYGDILPVSPIARSLASCEAIFGQLYPAAMIARLISLEFSFSKRVRRGVSREAVDVLSVAASKQVGACDHIEEATDED